jgi:hypothetical protein
MDRRWITEETKFTGPYMQGVRDFMKFVRQHVKEEESILCPCTRCHNVIRHDQNEVLAHLNCNGTCQSYTRWAYHGEALSEDESRSGDYGLYESDGEEGFEDVNDINYDDDASTMLDDLGKSGKNSGSIPNLYANLLEQAKRELHEGCNAYTRLSFVIRLLYIES